jgi:hypothetical protein
MPGLNGFPCPPSHLLVATSVHLQTRGCRLKPQRQQTQSLTGCPGPPSRLLCLWVCLCLHLCPPADMRLQVRTQASRYGKFNQLPRSTQPSVAASGCASVFTSVHLQTRGCRFKPQRQQMQSLTGCPGFPSRLLVFTYVHLQKRGPRIKPQRQQIHRFSMH